MILTADIGNTNIKLGLFDKNRLVACERLTTRTNVATETYGLELLQILRKSGFNPADIESVAASSVVPEASAAFFKAAEQLFSIRPLIVDQTIRTGIDIKTDIPSELGADRLVNAAAAFHEYGGPLLVIDFGTATTYDIVSKTGEFLGGVIAPGIGICAAALWEKTAGLPRVAIEKHDRLMGTDTASSMKSGVYFGYLGQLEYLVHHLKEERNTDFKVVATGGFSAVFQGNTDAIDVYDTELTLKGLNYISSINR